MPLLQARNGIYEMRYYTINALQHLKGILQGYNCMNQKCEHFKDVDEGNTSPNTKGL
jgi:hypothetical protein